MTPTELNRSLSTLFSELVYGTGGGFGFVLNGGDEGLIAALDGLSAEDVSKSRDGGATLAAHIEHLVYGLSLMNRWADGEDNPFVTADWSLAWTVSSVDEDEWDDIRRRLRDQAERWNGALKSHGGVTGIELDGMIASIVHLAYHLGAIRQIVPQTRGPRDGQNQES